jgi:hypothetical protein
MLWIRGLEIIPVTILVIGLLLSDVGASYIFSKHHLWLSLFKSWEDFQLWSGDKSRCVVFRIHPYLQTPFVQILWLIIVPSAAITSWIYVSDSAISS